MCTSRPLKMSSDIFDTKRNRAIRKRRDGLKSAGKNARKRRKIVRIRKVPVRRIGGKKGAEFRMIDDTKVDADGRWLIGQGVKSRSGTDRDFVMTPRPHMSKLIGRWWFCIIIFFVWCYYLKRFSLRCVGSFARNSLEKKLFYLCYLYIVNNMLWCKLLFNLRIFCVIIVIMLPRWRKRVFFLSGTVCITHPLNNALSYPTTDWIICYLTLNLKRGNY